MRKLRSDSLAYKIQERISALPGSIVLREDINDLGEYRQVSRAITSLIKRGILIRIAYGIYSKARYSTILNKTVIQGGFKEIACEALNRLSVKWEPSKAEQDYNARTSTQVPIRALVKLKSRFRRAIFWEGMQLKYE